jgi:hypothetical protein
LAAPIFVDFLTEFSCPYLDFTAAISIFLSFRGVKTAGGLKSKGIAATISYAVPDQTEQ